MTRLRALVVALLLLPVVGCQDEPTPDIPDPTPSSSAPSPSETESSPTTSPTPEALTPEETVRAWFAAFSNAMTTGDTSDVSHLSSPDCVSCQRLLTKVEDLYDKGGSLKTEGWEVVAMAPQPGSPSDKPTFVAQVTQARQVLFDADGNRVDVTPETKVAMRMTLFSADGWVVSRLEILT